LRDGPGFALIAADRAELRRRFGVIQLSLTSKQLSVEKNS
jgi:hypothetical protein